MPKNPTKRRVGRPTKDKCVESIPDTPKNCNYPQNLGT